MVLVFILFGIIILLMLLFTILLLSTIQIEIKNLKLENKENTNKSRIEDKYEIKITLYFLEKIPVFWVRLNSKKIRKISNSKRLQKIDFKKMKEQVPKNKETLEKVKNIKIKISKLNLRIDLGTEDAVLTSYLIAVIASVIGIVLPHITDEDKIQKCHYIVNPIYQNRNEYHISLDSIISIKIVHIIYNMLIFVKKGREKYERSSNRRSYAYRYE